MRQRRIRREFPRRHARPVPMGRKSGARQGRSDRWRREPATTKGDGFIPWTEEHVAAYERRWPIGTRQRVWLDVLIYTGLRRGDAVRLGRQHVRNGIGTIKTEKTGFTVEVTLPILPVLAETIAAGPCGDLTFIAGATLATAHQRMLRQLFRDACRAAGVPGSAHGVRKIAATTGGKCRRDSRATGSDLRLVGRHDGVALHALRRSQRLALEAMQKLANDQSNIYSLTFASGEGEEGETRNDYNGGKC